jgi:hypothetical protein
MGSSVHQEVPDFTQKDRQSTRSFPAEISGLKNLHSILRYVRRTCLIDHKRIRTRISNSDLVCPDEIIQWIMDLAFELGKQLSHSFQAKDPSR